MNNFQKHLDCRMVKDVFVMFILLFSFLLPSVIYADEESGLNTQEIDIQSYVNDMQPGWNLGNTFDAVGTDETAWGNPRVTKDLIDHIADQGFKSIRIPITFDQRMSGAPDYTVDADFLERVEQAVQWSLDADMYVMINIHHDSWIWIADGMGNNHDETVARFNAIWEQLADKFKDYPVELMFESINEPQFSADEDEQLEYLAELNASFFQIVRESGGNNDIRPLVLPTLNTGSEPEKLAALYEEINALNDPNLISTVHYYGFWPFSVNIAGHTTFDEETKQDIIDTFDRVYDQFVANGIPVIIGEFGLLGFDQDLNAIQQGEKLKFFEYMIYYAQHKDLTHMLWDNGQHFGRQSFEWSDQQLFNMMQSSWSTRSATAESDFIYLKKGEEIQDAELKLHLHGNEFVALRMNDQVLEEGQDYMLNGEQLIVKADLLAELTSVDELGVNEVLIAEFDHGIDWYFHVITYEEVTLQSTEGTTDNFKIPTLFNGDNLATLEAYYEDGSIAGPQDWTPFKEFAYTLSPLYESNEIILKENFFNEVNDGNVNLIFHFWSGQTYSYTLIKEGNNVIGIGEELPDPNLDKLINLIEQAESLLNEENKYTESSFNILKDALAKANATLTDSHSKIELEKALQDLQVAIDGLTEKPKEPTDPERPDPEPEREDKVISRPQISNGKATISSKDVAKLADKGQLVIDITDVDAVEEVYLTAEQVRELKQKNAQIIIEKRDIHITFPSTYLSGEEDVVIKIEAVSTAEYTIPQNKSLVGHIYKLTISEGDTLVNKFSSENPVTLSFAVDKNSVKNPEQLGVFYFNTDDSDWVDLGGEYADNFITVTTDHLSAFAVMEVEEISDNHEKPGKGKDPIIDHDDDQSDKDGEELPKTATSMYTMLFAGFVLIVLATVSLIVFRRKKEMTDL